MKEFLGVYNNFAPLIFMFIQIISIIFPLIPGGLTSVIGVTVFGAFYGFIYNYISIVIGSVLAFLIARKYGKNIVINMIGNDTYNKYSDWLDKGNKFTKAFAIAIFLPVAPDDILCYFSGLTTMSFKTFFLIIILGKPLSILAYSLGLYQILTRLF